MPVSIDHLGAWSSAHAGMYQWRGDTDNDQSQARTGTLSFRPSNGLVRREPVGAGLGMLVHVPEPTPVA